MRESGETKPVFGEVLVMACRMCGSEKQADFGAEINIHLPSRIGHDEPAVWLFPQLAVCFDCGSTLFRIPEVELRQLEKVLAA